MYVDCVLYKEANWRQGCSKAATLIFKVPPLFWNNIKNKPLKNKETVSQASFKTNIAQCNFPAQ